MARATAAKKTIRETGYDFDLDYLLTVGAAPEPEDYVDFWTEIYTEALKTQPKPEVSDSGRDVGEWRVFDIHYTSTNQTKIGGWLLLPKSGKILKGCVVGHGYGGRNEPDFNVPLENTAVLFYCARGISRSQHQSISNQPYWHVLHDIQDREKYVLRGCVEDTWLAASALLRLFPTIKNRIGYMGTSFGGGIGAMALAWDKRFKLGYFCVPSFGNQLLRLKLKSIGSAFSLQRFERKNPDMARYCLQWYDASIAAQYIDIPVFCVCAKFDPVVAPPGQFSIYNSLKTEDKELYVLEKGHVEYEGKNKQAMELQDELREFFANL